MLERNFFRVLIDYHVQTRCTATFTILWLMHAPQSKQQTRAESIIAVNFQLSISQEVSHPIPITTITMGASDSKPDAKAGYQWKS